MSQPAVPLIQPATRRIIVEMGKGTEMTPMPEDVRRQCETLGIPVAVSLAEHCWQTAVYGVSAFWVPAAHPSPEAAPLSGSGYYGQSCPREIPDTPFAEWEAGVEALLAACEQWQAQTEEVLNNTP